ncbi:MAG: hypothetical protein M1825_001806 [Sarcosagium campestre]|nr:MAG: hypothetical protein M1825_001806 [Sarcosagium campestre]
MSTSSRLVRHASTQRAFSATAQSSFRYYSGPSAARAAFLRTHARALSPQTSAFAILIPRRNVSTEIPHAASSGASNPPPGFNAAEAKKPLPKDNGKSAQSGSSRSAASRAQEDGHKTSATKSAADSTEKNSLSELASSKAAEAKTEEQKLEAKKDEKKKLTISQKIKREIMHYWDGTKLLATEVRISTKLALKMAAGYELSRREHRQLQRTVQDLGRLVPFSVFVIVPFAELLLPVALKLFPNMLPSTYEGQKSRDAKATNLRATRKEVSNLLRNTLKETGLPLNPTIAQKEDFAEFFRKVRTTGESPTQADVVKVCKIFKDDLTLDNLSRPQLVGMTRYMNLNTFGTDMMLRYQIRHRMRQIKRDDKAISFEGVDSLSVPELQHAAASRGLRTHGLSPARLRDDLQMWLDLRLKYGIPSTLLILSNAFMYTQSQGKDSEMSSQIDALTGVLSSIPEELFHEIELEVHNAEGAATNKQRLEVLKEQQDLIEEENEQNESGGQDGARETPKDDEDIDEKEEAPSDDSALSASQSAQASEAAKSAEQDSTEASRAAMAAASAVEETDGKKQG